MTSSSSELLWFGVRLQVAAVPDDASAALPAPPASVAPVRTRTFRLEPAGEPLTVAVTVSEDPPPALVVNCWSDPFVVPVPLVASSR